MINAQSDSVVISCHDKTRESRNFNNFWSRCQRHARISIVHVWLTLILNSLCLSSVTDVVLVEFVNFGAIAEYPSTLATPVIRLRVYASKLSKFTGDKVMLLVCSHRGTLTLKVHWKSGYAATRLSRKNKLIVLRIHWKIGYASTRLHRQNLSSLSKCNEKVATRLHRENLFILSKFTKKVARRPTPRLHRENLIILSKFT